MSKALSLILFLLLTQFGSSLTTVTGFLLPHDLFQSVDLLAWALALKVLSSVFFSAIHPRYFSNWSVMKLLTLSQVFGLIALSVIWIAIHFVWPGLFLFGIFLSGLPMTWLGIGMTTGLRTTTSTDAEFRSFSGSRDLIAGGCLLTAGVLTPIALTRWGYSTVFAIDMATFVLGLLFLSGVKLPQAIASAATRLSVYSDVLKSNSYRRFCAGSVGALILIGFAPLVAGSTAIFPLESLSSEVTRSFWAVEGAVIMFSGFFYSRAHSFLIAQPLTLVPFQLSAVFLAVAVYSHWATAALVASVIVALAPHLMYQKARDDLIIECGSDTVSVAHMSAMAILFRSALCALSPLLLKSSFLQWGAGTAVLTFLCFQVAILFIYRVLR